MLKQITYQQYRDLFKQDDDGKYINLIINDNDDVMDKKLNLIGKRPSDLTIDEIVKVKKYAAQVFKLIDKIQ